MSDLADRLADLQLRNARVPDDQAKEIFLSGLYEGKTKGEAAREAGRTSTWFRRRCNPEAATYDPEFHERYDHATAANRAEIVEDVFTALVNAAKEGNVRAQEKLLAAYSGDFSFLRPQMGAGTVNVEQLQVFFGQMSLEQLLALKEARQEARKALPPVIDQ